MSRVTAAHQIVPTRKTMGQTIRQFSARAETGQSEKPGDYARWAPKGKEVRKQILKGPGKTKPAVAVPNAEQGSQKLLKQLDLHQLVKLKCQTL